MPDPVSMEDFFDKAKSLAPSCACCTALSSDPLTMLSDQAVAMETSLQTSLALKVPPYCSPSTPGLTRWAELHVLQEGAASKAEMLLSSYLKTAEVLASLAVYLDQMQSWVPG